MRPDVPNEHAHDRQVALATCPGHAVDGGLLTKCGSCQKGQLNPSLGSAWTRKAVGQALGLLPA